MQTKLLTIRLSSMGDVAILIPTFLSFHQKYPDSKILLITKAQFIPLFQQMAYIETYAINPTGQKIQWRDIWACFQRLKREESRVFLDFHGVIRTFLLDGLLMLAGFKVYRIHKDRQGKKELIRAIPKTLVPMKSSAERYADVFRKAGFDFQINKNLFLEKDSIDKKGVKWIGIAPFAKFESKMYDLEKMNEVIRAIAASDKVKLWIFGNGNKEKHWAHKFFDLKENIELCINRYSLKEELELISHLDLMVSMDSANGHIASNYQVPVITLWGTTHPCLGFAPYQQPADYSLFPDKVKFPYLPVSYYGKCSDEHYSRAIDSIEVSLIVEKVKSILQID